MTLAFILVPRLAFQESNLPWTTIPANMPPMTIPLIRPTLPVTTAVLSISVHRPSRLLERLPGASKKMLTDTLRALERDGLVARRVFPEVPVRVEYSLTPLGWTTAEPLMALADWGAAEGARAAAARTSYGRTDSRAAAA